MMPPAPRRQSTTHPVSEPIWRRCSTARPSRWTRRDPRRSPAVTPAAIARRGRTCADLCDQGSFSEYGALAVAAQRDRRSLEDLLTNTPADGLIGGTANVNGALFGEARTRCAVISYDYMVLAGTQGFQGHRKKDRLFELAERFRLPLVLFAEGGGGRPGDTAAPQVSGLEVMAFALFGRLSGLVPLVGVVSGRCFAGNAALLGCCDVIIATEDSSIGMAGPAMIEGGGLGRVEPDEVGPVSVQAANGVIDVVVTDEAAAVDAAKQLPGVLPRPPRGLAVPRPASCFGRRSRRTACACTTCGR